MLNNCPIRVTTAQMKPYVLQIHNVDTLNDNGNLRYDGIEIKIIKTIARKMQFTMNFT